MATLPDLSTLTLNPHDAIAEDSPNGAYCLDSVERDRLNLTVRAFKEIATEPQQFGIYMPQIVPRTITPSRGSIAPDVERDGQCLFHCLSKLHNRTFGKYKNTMQVVEDVRSYLDTHWARMSEAHDEKSDKATYLSRVGVIWGGPLEIDAASELYNANIFEWTSVDADRFLTDEQALSNAVLSARYHPNTVSKESRTALPSWDVFLHNGHYRYLEKTTSGRIHNAAAQPQEPFKRLERPRKAAPHRMSMNDQLRKMAEERASRKRLGTPDDVCYTDPISDPGDEATMRLVRELLAHEEQAERDAAMARRLAYE